MHDDAKRRLDEDLVWYLNGSLDAEGCAFVARYASEHPEAEAEIRYWQAVRAAVKDTTPQRAADAGLDEFMRRARAPARTRATAAGALRAWLGGALRAFATPKLGLTAASLIIVVQAGIIAVMLADHRAASVEAESPAAMTRSLEPGGPAPPFVKVRFKPTATARDIDRLLAEANASIIAGPMQGGYYAIKLRQAGGDGAAAKIKSSHLVDEVIGVESAAAPSR